MLRSALRRTTLRQRLVLIFLGYTIAIMLLVGAVWGTQFEMRAVALTRELLAGGVRSALDAGQQLISVETARSAAEGNNAAAADLAEQLNALSALSGRTAITGDVYAETNAGNYRWLTGNVVRTENAPAEAPLPADETTIDPPERIARGHVCSLLSAETPRIALCITADGSWVFEGRDTIVQTLIIIALAALPVIILIAYAISRGITLPVFRLVNAAEALGKGEPYDPAPLRTVEEYGAELSVLARVFSKMAAEVQAREAALKAQLESLVIQIDSAKKDAHVSEITESEFFRELQRKKQQLRAGSASTGTAKSDTVLDSSSASENESTQASDIDTDAGARL